MIFSLVLDTGDLLLNIPRIYTAFAQWLSLLIFIVFSRKRFNKPKTVLLIGSFLLVMIGFNLWSHTWDLKFWILGMITSVVLMFLFFSLITKTTSTMAGYITVIAFVLSEFSASLEWQLEYFLIINDKLPKFLELLTFSPINIHVLRITPIFILTYGLIFYLLFLLESRLLKHQKGFNVSNNDLYTVLVIGILVFTISNLSFLNIDTPISSNNPIEMFYIRTLVNLSGIIILYSQREHKNSLQKRLEVFTMQNLLDKQYEQYRFSKVTTELVNQKYHDLKNYIALIRAETNVEKKLSYLDTIDESIKVFDYIYETGNHALDVMLYSKQDIFKEYNINFSCVADGSILNFMNVLDIVSIFGNSIDNSIESLKTINDPEKRLLKLAIYQEANLVIVRVENYYESDLKYQFGSLVTTKTNKDYHGFGLKSIETTIDKYYGTVSIDTEENWFTLLMLIPIPNTK